MKVIRILIVTMVSCLFGFSISVEAAQFDSPFEATQKKHADKWAKEDKVINEKLAALQKKFGKKPNIIYILADDIGWGELGWQGGGKHRGTPTHELDKMAYEGMRFYAAYSEPSCTPSRIAINTGRHPVRTGLTSVLWPGAEEGLVAEEKTVAEVLSEAGYHTAMWGKWHLGEEPEHLPENQGYDYAYYGVWNGMIDAWEASAAFYKNNMPQNVEGNSPDYPGREAYLEETGIDVSIAAYVGEKGKGRKPVKGAAGIPGAERQEAFENESIKQITAYVKDKANSDKPFFIYWATYTQQISGSNEYKNAPHVDHANAHASFMAMHNDHIRQLLDTLRDAGIDENTLVVWWSDNGPMYAFYPTAGSSFLKGAKGDVTEGGVKVPAMAWWPGMIEPNQDPVDFIHLTDLYTTAARLGGAMDKIPSDRIVDGLDQTSLLHALRVWGPSGSTPEMGTKYAMDHFLKFVNWDRVTREYKITPIPGQVETIEFDYRVPDQIIYQDNGVTIRSYPAINIGDGPVSFMFEYAGMKVLFSGDTVPNKWFVKYGKGVDLAIHEAFFPPETFRYYYNQPPQLAWRTCCEFHTSAQAFGKIMSTIKPRHAVAFHFFNEEGTRYEVYDGIRETYDGPLSLATDMMVWNITKDKITERMAVSTDDAWSVPGTAEQAGPEKRDNPLSDSINKGRWVPAFKAQDPMLDLHMEKYYLQDQDWRPAMYEKLGQE